jgi:hypothetical protein
MPSRTASVAVLVLGLALACPLPGGSARAAGPASPLADLVEVGSGDMTWLGLDIYGARLLSDSGRYPDAADGPLALEITYRRTIPRERLVRTTGREWQRLARQLGLGDATQTGAWLEQLARIWPDVSPGDRIIALREPAGPTRFYGNDGLLGVVADPEFGPAFLGIWLHPDTRAGELRAGLLGARR